MPEGGALTKHNPGVIRDRRSFEAFRWGNILSEYKAKYREDFSALAEVMPAGMKVVGGAGFGVFECAQEITGYEQLCLISADDPGLYADLFRKTGDMMHEVWKWTLDNYSDLIAVGRFGDDLGFKSSTLISPGDIRKHIIPQYKKLVGLIHGYGKPFIWHSCGNIFSIMDDVIENAGINAKHSNEDAIAPFTDWIERYGRKIGNFGGIDTDVICRKDPPEVKEYTKEVFMKSTALKGKKGIAFGTGNSVPVYARVDSYLAMINTIRELRGE